MIFLVKLISLLPLWLLYFLADFAQLILRLIGYREGVIHGNLSRSFPEKSEQEIREIMRSFYCNFANFFVETLKGYTISKSELTKRVKFTNLAVLDEFVEKQQSVVFFVAHQFNWEWALQAGSFQLPMQLDGIYQKLNSPTFDKLVLETRSKFGAFLIEREASIMQIVRRKNIFRGLSIIADQIPHQGAKSERYWTTFLNQETAFFTGGEKIAKLLKMPTLFMNIQSPKQGYYEIEFIKLTEPPYEANSNQIVEKYVRATEKLISENPSNWLWSHKRWKYNRSNKEIHEIEARKEKIRKKK